MSDGAALEAAQPSFGAADKVFSLRVGPAIGKNFTNAICETNKRTNEHANCRMDGEMVFVRPSEDDVGKKGPIYSLRKLTNNAKSANNIYILTAQGFFPRRFCPTAARSSRSTFGP